MGTVEIIIMISAIAIVVGVFVSRIIAHKKGKGCCDCSDCPYSCNCHSKTNNNEKKTNENAI